MELRDLQKMTVVKLREEALKTQQLTGVHGMDKRQLIEALAPLYGIDLAAASRAAKEKFAADKPGMKRHIRLLKAERDAAVTDGDAAAAAAARKRVKKYKRALRRMTRQTPPTV